MEKIRENITDIITSIRNQGPVPEDIDQALIRMGKLKQLTDEDFDARDINVDWVVPACWTANPEHEVQPGGHLDNCHLCPHQQVCPTIWGFSDHLVPFVEENDHGTVVGLGLD